MLKSLIKAKNICEAADFKSHIVAEMAASVDEFNKSAKSANLQFTLCEKKKKTPSVFLASFD